MTAWTEGRCIELSRAQSLPSGGRRVLPGLRAMAVVGLFMTVVQFCCACGSALEVQELHPGEPAVLRSGLVVTVPENTSATFSRWREPPDEYGLLPPADELTVRSDSPRSYREVEATTYWPAHEGEQPSLNIVERRRLVSASADGTVAVWWSGRRDNALVWIVTRAPDKFPGVVSIYPSRAESRRQAWREAQEVWQWLHVSGADLPPRP